MSSTIMRRLVRAGALAVLAALVGCGGGGTEPTPVVPSLIGEFTGTWTQELLVSAQAIPTVECPCTLTVPSQTGHLFYGRSALAAPCDQGLLAGQGRGGVLAISDGNVQDNGAVSFRFGEDPQVGLSSGGCTVTAMPAFTGTFSGNTLSVQRTEGYDCTAADGNRYDLTIRLVASRN